MHQFRSGSHGHRAASQQLAVQLDPAALAIPERHGPSAAGSHDRQEGGDSSTARSRGRQVSFQKQRLLVQNLHGETVVREQIEHDLDVKKSIDLRCSANFCSKSGCLEYSVGCHGGADDLWYSAGRAGDAYSLFLRKNLIALGWNDAGDLHFRIDNGIESWRGNLEHADRSGNLAFGGRSPAGGLLIDRD